MTKTSIKIHKKNEIIRGKDRHSVMAKRALNAVYWAFQKHKIKGNKVLFNFTTLRKLLKLENDNRYVETIKEAMRELREPIELNNFKHPNGTKYDWYSLSFLDEVGFDKKDDEWKVELTVNATMRTMMLEKKNFTLIELEPYMNNLRTKYSMKLYEYLKSFGAYRYLNITQNHLMKLFNIEDNKTYKYYSDLTRLLERQLTEISKKTDLVDVKLIKTPTLKKDKIFRIIISPKSKKDADSIQAKTVLDNMGFIAKNF